MHSFVIFTNSGLTALIKPGMVQWVTSDIRRTYEKNILTSPLALLSTFCRSGSSAERLSILRSMFTYLSASCGRGVCACLLWVLVSDDCFSRHMVSLYCLCSMVLGISAEELSGPTIFFNYHVSTKIRSRAFLSFSFAFWHNWSHSTHVVWYTKYHMATLVILENQDYVDHVMWFFLTATSLSLWQASLSASARVLILDKRSIRVSQMKCDRKKSLWLFLLWQFLSQKISQELDQR